MNSSTFNPSDLFKKNSYSIDSKISYNVKIKSGFNLKNILIHGFSLIYGMFSLSNIFLVKLIFETIPSFYSLIL